MQNFTEDEKKILLAVADAAIKFGLKNHRALKINLENYPKKLQENGACFVTLEINNQLRGCIGSLIAHQPLIIDVADNAYNAAFRDPRFMPLSEDEYPEITKHISVLTKPELMHFTSEDDLLRQIRPNVDGLILTENGYCGTFLPSVWEELPDKKLFLMHLKLKAGLSENYWSDTIKVERYTTEMIE